MAYPRSSRAYKRPYKKSYKRKTPWYNKRYNALQLATQAAKGVWYLKGLVNSEMLHHDRTETNVSISSTGSILNLVAIGQGDTAASNRTGNSILMRNHLTRIRFTKSSAATTTIVRYMIFQDTQQVGDTSPAVTDVLDTADVDSPLNLAASGRFKVLCNKTISLHSNYPIFHKETYKSLYSHIRYNGTTSSDIQKNGLYMLVIADQATNVPVMDLWSRIGYHDN